MAQGQILRKDETETTQAWNSQEPGAGIEGSVKETQENPAPTDSGIVRKRVRIVLYAQVPPKRLNHDNEQITFAVMIGNKMLCAVAFRQKHGRIAGGRNHCKVNIRNECHESDPASLHAP